MWEEDFAPDGTRFQSRAAAWRHAAAADAADVGESSAGVADADRMFQPVAGESPGSVSDGDVPLLEFVSGAPSVRRAASLEQVDPPASVGQRPSGLAVPPEDVAAALLGVARAGGAGSRMARELI